MEFVMLAGNKTETAQISPNCGVLTEALSRVPLNDRSLLPKSAIEQVHFQLLVARAEYIT